MKLLYREVWERVRFMLSYLCFHNFNLQSPGHNKGQISVF
uniref:Uncharacterized protein n=1 Tax=Rhizophora mucronata TaxID=61149 RepID=A0A2P2N9D6_RHIMU